MAITSISLTGIPPPIPLLIVRWDDSVLVEGSNVGDAMKVAVEVMLVMLDSMIVSDGDLLIVIDVAAVPGDEAL